MTLEELFCQKHTENGDLSFTKVSNNNLLNILFLTEYYQKHLEVHIGTSDIEQLFSMFIRDPRFGLGKKDLGRALMWKSKCPYYKVIKAGRWDDIYHIFDTRESAFLFYSAINDGDELAKKWCPRYSSKHLTLAREFAKQWNMNKQEYGHFVKCDTTENKFSRKSTEAIEFEHVPSLALLKYYKRFQNGEDTKERFAKYLEAVKAGKKELHVSTSTVYDIYQNKYKIDADLFFDKLEKIALSCIPIVDTSGSMCNSNDSLGKALAIGHYLAKCSTYAPNKVISFSSHPQLITLGTPIESRFRRRAEIDFTSIYAKEIDSMITGDCSNTDFGAVLELLKGLNKWPEYLVVLSDMEFDQGSNKKKDEVEQMFEERGINTKIIWWNLNARNITCPEMDNKGNIFLSGYSPMLLKYLQVGFNGEMFLNILLEEYKKNINY